MLILKQPLARLTVCLALAVSITVPRAQTPGAQAPARAQQPAGDSAVAGKLTSPMAEWGHGIGDDYFLANYQQLTAYWKKPRRSRRGFASSTSARRRRAGRC